MPGRTFVMGDIHGACRALRQCLERAAFHYKHDHLIFLGDACDGWPESKETIDELLKIPNLTAILGNHDDWTLQWMKTGYIDDVWFRQGGEATIKSYASIPDAHIAFLEGARSFRIKDNRLFVHAGIDPKIPVLLQNNDTFLWDRTLAYEVLEDYKNSTQRSRYTSFNEVYLGHTPVHTISEAPLCQGEVWLMDTGAGWDGRLSMMDIDTKEVFSSDRVPTLYPGVKGRKKRSSPV